MQVDPAFSGPGERFKFGENWAAFLRTLNDERIEVAESSIRKMLGTEFPESMRFLDIGCGSGLFSLAAVRLGASVHSFDFDPASVECAERLRNRYFPDVDNWSIERGDVLDTEYIASLGAFDVVYSWGVLHHTGEMWKALANAAVPVRRPGGRLFIAIYNDMGGPSRRWLKRKRTHNRLPDLLKVPHAILYLPLLDWKDWLGNLLQGKVPWDHWNRRRLERGMSYWHDLKDWVGGYPYEFAKPERIFDFYRERGFRLDRLTTVGGGHGNNEFVFTSL